MTELNPDLAAKLTRLKAILAELGSALVAYSGGVDSTLLLRVARDVLGDRVVAATASSQTYPAAEIRLADELARQMGVRQLHLETDELADQRFVSNPPERCYYCKAELFAKLSDLARANGLACVVDGANADDSNDFRPGARAAREFGVRSPLREAGLTKDDIRALARSYGLPNWDKPSLACLASRFPYGARITEDKLQQVDAAESFLRELGIRQLRVRHHGEIARIEVADEDMPRVLERRREIAAKLKSLGFAYAALDLLGYRTGSLNETLSDEVKRAAL